MKCHRFHWRHDIQHNDIKRNDTHHTFEGSRLGSATVQAVLTTNVLANVKVEHDAMNN